MCSSEMADEYRQQDRHPDYRDDVLRNTPHVDEQAVHRLRRHEGPEDPRARRARVHGAAKSCGANPTPIAFAEVYLALQNGTVDAQENPLTTIEAKKFYEVQKYIMLTGHIVDSLTTQIAPHVWTKLSDADKKIFTDVTQEAAQKATAEITKHEGELVDEFKKKGITVTAVDKKSFQEAINKAVSLESMGYQKADWDKIQAIK